MYKPTRYEEMKVKLYWILNRLFGPDEWKGFVGFLCTLSGIPLLFSYTQAPSFRGVIPVFLQELWGISLTLGGASLLLGQRRGMYIIERLGLRLLAYTSLIYATAMVFAYNFRPPVSMAFVLGFSGTCARSLLKQNFENVVDKEADYE